MVGTRSLSVVFLVSAYPWELNPVSGVFHETSAQALKSLGASVQVISPRPYVPRILGRMPTVPVRWRAATALPQLEVRSGVAVHRPLYLATPRQHYWSCPHLLMRRGVLRAIREIGSIDVLHGHFAYPHGLLAVKLARHLGLRSVLTLHGSDVNVFPKVSTLSRRRFRGAVQGANHVLAVSEALAAVTETLVGRRPEHLPIGLDLTRFSETRIDAERTEYRRRAGISRDDFVVLFVGNYTAAKGIHELVSVLSSLSDQGVVGLFVGTGPLAREIRAIPRAIDMGRQPNSEIPAILKLADVLVLPSHREGLPTVVVEAGATGLPVVATRVGGIPELLSPDRGYLVEPMDVRQLQAAITQVMRSPGDSSARAKRLNEHVRKHYDAIGNARRLLSVYGHPRLNRTNPDALDS